MKLFRILVLIVATCGACAAAANPATTLTPSQKSAIGRKIWQNECAGQIDGLTAWNVGEEFPSLGIGHFIWYPNGFRGPFEESWPKFVAFARGRGVKLPAVAMLADSPWESRQAFRKEFRSPQMAGLRAWLADHMALQTDFIVARSRAALPKVLAAAPANERERIAANYQKVASTPHGVYALVDYVNFKGDGCSPGERYQGHGWGLLQVLATMRQVPSGPAAATEFAAAAKLVLARRVAKSPKARSESRWLPGWQNRCATYARPLAND